MLDHGYVKVCLAILFILFLYYELHEPHITKEEESQDNLLFHAQRHMRSEGYFLAKRTAPLTDEMSCIVSMNFKFVYVHVPNTGGKLVSDALLKILCSKGTCKPDVFRKYAKCSSIPSKCSEFFAFSFVENPERRIARIYYAAGRDKHPRMRDLLSFGEFLASENPPKSLQGSTGMPVYQAYSQHRLLYKNGWRVNFVGHIETIHETMPLVMLKCGITYALYISYESKTELSERQKSLVRTGYYSNDYAIYGYSRA